MNDQPTYYSEHDAEDAMAVIAGWIGKNYDVKVVYHNGTAVDADIYNGVIRIPRLACATGLTKEALMLLRSRVYHESGHIGETKLAKSDSPKGALFQILNSLEDVRMEAVLSSQHKGCEIVFREATSYYNRKIAQKISEGLDKPLWEALVAMQIKVCGEVPAWKLNEKAQAYVDAAYSEFIKVRQCGSTYDALELAKVIYKILKDKNEELKKDQPEEQKPDPKQDQNKKDQKDQGEDGDDGEGEDGEGDDQKPSSGGGDDFDDEEKSGKGDGESEDGKDDGDEEGEGESNSDEGEGDDEGKSGKGSKGDSEESDDADDGEDGEGNKSGQKSKGKDSKGESKDDPEGELQPGDSTYDPNRNEPQKSGSGVDKRDLEEEGDDLSMEKIQNEDLAEIFKNMPIENKEYLSRRDLDRHEVPEVTDTDKVSYRERLSQVGVAVNSMTRALEQSLRSMAKMHKSPYLRNGRLDMKRLVPIAKGLSKEVFYKTRPGMKLDVAVEIIIDESGSMGNFYEVQLLAMAIGEALTAINIPFEITGSTTLYSGGSGNMPSLDGFQRVNPIVYKHYKKFTEKWAGVRSRMVRTYHHKNNVDGEVVEYAAFRLMQRPERRKVIFSLSDGEPCAGHSNESVMAMNLKRVCKRVRKQGVEVYSASILTDSPAGLYGREYSVVIPSVKNMGPDIIRFFVKMLTEGRVTV
jgi:cobalamin biosynthesis protein CobT